MFAKIKHLAIVSEKGELVGEFYKSIFGMKSSGGTRASGAIAVGDGYVGLNINPRKPGRQAGLDHFGFEVEDVGEVKAWIDLSTGIARYDWTGRPGALGEEFGGTGTAIIVGDRLYEGDGSSTRFIRNGDPRPIEEAAACGGIVGKVFTDLGLVCRTPWDSFEVSSTARTIAPSKSRTSRGCCIVTPPPIRSWVRLVA